jgi:hypothetical protein
MEIKIETVENGFVVYEYAAGSLCGKKWAFESATSLARFVLEWGECNTKTKKEEQPVNANN